MQRRRVTGGSSDRIGWVARHLLPQEQAVRAWLRRARVADEEADDIVQDAYSRVAGLERVDHIARPSAYFQQTVRNILIERRRRAPIVSLDGLTEMGAPDVEDERPSPARAAEDRSELAYVLKLIDRLPDRVRTVIRLRRIEGLSQREIAARLGVTEAVVENDVSRGLRAVMAAMRGDQAERGR